MSAGADGRALTHPWSSRRARVSKQKAARIRISGASSAKLSCGFTKRLRRGNLRERENHSKRNMTIFTAGCVHLGSGLQCMTRHSLFCKNIPEKRLPRKARKRRRYWPVWRSSLGEAILPRFAIFNVRNKVAGKISFENFQLEFRAK